MELEDFDAEFWKGKDDLCLGCMPAYMVNELRHQEHVRRQLIAKGYPYGPIGISGRSDCIKCGGPRPGPWPKNEK